MKAIVKHIIFFVSAVLISPMTLMNIVLSSLFDKDQVLSSFSQFLSLLPSKLGVYLRAGFYRFALTYCSPDAVVSFLVLFSQKDTEISEGVYIGPQCNIGRCRIEKNTLLGSGVHIMSGKEQHNFSDLTRPIKEQGGTFQKVRIGQNCWIGNGAMIMANIGANCIVGAGSVVLNDIPDNSIVAGNPARVIKPRG
ncbi:Maltose O-acetyltransferase [Paraglaciecola mesophila]|uniref:Maltose O-acetyltransferase n=1 Tax=Paraglaciecola mesophila TaxID=197222 RepID=A0A857JGX8_9ALTE|nr:acyltransferase [Paraglaciecola mesophila]QHJ11289.1 Maltose O-acetyltransferase [Paraglaciecola mesophila]